eukprot:CAMPEP_0177198300 /NCGR_PEP_ID=MMETSP0367-20130122/25061_1 /TAXON_ID=447022 ORGANISM="Scrippsiella hangoei-like, Strain SHHI-4" /NCGR_SAMPLE_ID=MMETSP0367 /ASSEMBLY_ACC=CAM_ASM_000362 /LENGTH=351 /DNA_ID=CAMNT_0018646561 /DNA_START=4 /DNA_END=1059 /DNA_ORIENTATION=+
MAGVLPVKHTFIHFGGGMGGPLGQGEDADGCAAAGGGMQGRRVLRRGNTEPDKLPRARLFDESTSQASVAPDGEVDSSLVGIPLRLMRTSSPMGGSTDVSNISTPDPSPRYTDLGTPVRMPCSGHDPWSPSPAPSATSPPSDMQTAGSYSAVGAYVGLQLPGATADLNVAGRGGAAFGAKVAGFVLSSRAAQPSDSFFGGYTFTFTLRLADGSGLGVDVLSSSTSNGLIVEQVLQGGAIEAWNRQCWDGTSMVMKAVFKDDAIVSVNGKTDCQSMLQECRNKVLLKIKIVRKFSGDPLAAHLAPAPCHMWSDALGLCCMLGASCPGCNGPSQHIAMQERSRLHSDKSLFMV